MYVKDIYLFINIIIINIVFFSEPPARNRQTHLSPYGIQKTSSSIRLIEIGGENEKK